MAMDERLQGVKEKLFDTQIRDGRNTPEYEAAFTEYLEVLKVVAVERGSGVLDYENPNEYIISEILEDGNEEDIEAVLKEYEMMIAALEEVGFRSLGSWKKSYTMCTEAFKKMKEGTGVSPDWVYDMWDEVLTDD